MSPDFWILDFRATPHLEENAQKRYMRISTVSFEALGGEGTEIRNLKIGWDSLFFQTQTLEKD